MASFAAVVSLLVFGRCVAALQSAPPFELPATATISLPPSVVSVLDFGAVGDGVHDNTAAFTRAIAALNGSGGVVFVPSGQFAFDGAIALPDGTSLVGTYVAVPNHDLRRTAGVLAVDGSQLLPRAGHGDATGVAFITLGASAALRGFTIIYPKQDSAAAPVPYPWTVNVTDRDGAVYDVELLNSWNGINVINAPRFSIARVQGQPVNVGLFVDAVHDIGRIQDVHWNPWFSNAPAWVAWQAVHGVGFQLGRSDWQYMLNTFVFGMAVGYWFVETPDGVVNGNFVGIGADACSNASIVIDGTKMWGVVITNAELTSKAPYGPDAADHTQVIVNAANNGTVRFVNSVFWGPSHAVARLYGSGVVSFSDCVFHQWDWLGTGRAAVEAYNGTVSIRGSEFHKFRGTPASPLLALFPGVQRALFSENVVDGALTVSNQAPAALVVIKDNLPSE